MFRYLERLLSQWRKPKLQEELSNNRFRGWVASSYRAGVSVGSLTWLAPELIWLLGDTDQQVRRGAAELIALVRKHMTGQPSDLTGETRKLRKRALRHIRRYASVLYDRTLPLLNDENPSARAAALWAVCVMTPAVAKHRRKEIETMLTFLGMAAEEAEDRKIIAGAMSRDDGFALLRLAA